jgi:quinol monooxygenase YgiN
MQTGHMQAFIDKSAGFFAGPPVISFCQGISVGGE